MANTEITIIRHGETEWNVQQRYQGQLDSPLTKNGINQAHSAGKLLKDHEFNYFISSDLKRAIDTSNIISEYINQNFDTTSTEIRERNFGIVQGYTKPELKDKMPGVLKSLFANNPDHQVPEGESFEMFYNRVANFFDNLAKQQKGKKILVVSHGGVLNCIFRHALRIPLNFHRNFSIKNSSINVLQHNEQGWFVDTWGKTSSSETFILSNMY